MGSALATLPPTGSSLSHRAKPEENSGQKIASSYIEINISAFSDKKIKQPSDVAKANVSSLVLSTEQRYRNSAQALYDRLPDAEECELVSEAQAKSVLAKIHHGMSEFKSLFNKDNPAVNCDSEPSNDFENKPFQYIIYKIQAVFFDAFKEMAADYARANQILTEFFKEQMKESHEMELERLEKIKEEKAKAYKSGMVSAAIDGGCAVFAIGTGIATGGASIVALGWIGTGVAAGIKAYFECDALTQRAAGNNKEAEESEQIVQIAGVIEMAGLFFTLSVASIELAAEATIKNTSIVNKLSAKFGTPTAEQSLVADKTELFKATQEALKFEELKVNLKTIEELTPPLWEGYSGLKPLIKDTLCKQWQAAEHIRRITLSLRSASMGNNALLKAEIAQCEGLIQDLSQKSGALKKLAQNVTQQFLKDNADNLRDVTNRFLKLLKIVQSLLAQHAATILTASNTMHVAA